MKGHDNFVRTWEISDQKQILKSHLQLNFNNFQEMINGKVLCCYNILTIGIDIIRFHVNIISELVFSIILWLFLLHIPLEGEY